MNGLALQNFQTLSFSVFLTHSRLCAVVFMIPDWESVGLEFRYMNFLESIPSLILYKIGKTRMSEINDTRGRLLVHIEQFDNLFFTQFCVEECELIDFKAGVNVTKTRRELPSDNCGSASGL